jgi:RNA polymerase primary sigma factor
MKRKIETHSTIGLAPSALDLSRADLFADTAEHEPAQGDAGPDDSALAGEEQAVSAARPRAGRRSATGMPLYARAMAEHPVLDAAGERALAAEIEARSAAVWTALLRDEVIAPFIIGVAADRIEGAGPALEEVRAAADLAAQERSASARRALARAAAAAGVALHALDLDHAIADDLVDVLRRAAADPASAPDGLPVARHRRRLERHAGRAGLAARSAADARNELVQRNIGLVFFIAARYRSASMPLPDLVQEGTIGLLKAVGRFDHRRGVRFSTYATWWIRHAIGRALSDKSRLVRLPVHIQEARQRLDGIRQRLRTELSRDPSADEIAAAARTTADKVEAVMRAASTREISLDQPVGEDEDRTRMDVLQRPDEDPTSPVERLSRAERASDIPDQIARLSPKEGDIVRRRFGLDGSDHEWTLQEIADEYGLSRERIRQIEARALSKLRGWLAEARGAEAA